MTNLLENDPVKEVTKFRGVPIHIEWRKGETREYSWSKFHNLMHYFYGFIPKTNTSDGMETDVCVYDFKNQHIDTVYKLTQLKKGKFDEYKYCLGFESPEQVKSCYVKTMEPKMFGGTIELSWDQFLKEITNNKKDEGIVMTQDFIENLEEMVRSELTPLQEMSVEKGNLILGEKIKNPIDVIRKLARLSGVPIGSFFSFVAKKALMMASDKALTKKYTPWYNQVIKDLQKVQPSIRRLPLVVLRDKQVNAGCVLNSLVMFTSGAMALNKDLRTFILAHEVTHAMDDHVFETLMLKIFSGSSFLLGLLLMLIVSIVGAEAVSTAFGLPGLGTTISLAFASKQVIVLAGVVAGVVTAFWARGLEKEADLSSINLIKAAYGDKFPFDRVFSELRVYLSKKDKNYKPTKSDHPKGSQRIRYMKSHLKNLEIRESNPIRNYIYNSYCKDLVESILDPDQKTLSNKIWDNRNSHYKIKSSVKKYIIDYLNSFIENYNLSWDNIKKLYIVGSITSFKYNEESDIDLTVETNLSNEKMDPIWKEIDKWNSKNIPGTKHPLNLFVMNFKKPLTSGDARYNLLDDTWEKKPQHIKSDINFREAYKIAQEEIDEFNDAETSLNASIESYRDNPNENIKEDIFGYLDFLKIKYLELYHLRQEPFIGDQQKFLTRVVSSENDNNYTLQNIIWKILERKGVIDKLKNYKKIHKKIINAPSTFTSLITNN